MTNALTKKVFEPIHSFRDSSVDKDMACNATGVLYLCQNQLFSEALDKVNSLLPQPKSQAPLLAVLEKI